MQICNDQPWLATCKKRIIAFFALFQLLDRDYIAKSQSHQAVLHVCLTRVRRRRSQNRFKFPLQG
ncbi:Protein of unknown function [Pyronema omphalodes CBS 100304]|uniref:Uncharacterized protein n=1 Tax=Pyronema omphalodes (strain CBS 100304) TaxID=1076935 RepID=U4LWW6_PYROM|nr:Protein of unknown function [Pyronema omphalodes CBS 100304]